MKTIPSLLSLALLAAACGQTQDSSSTKLVRLLDSCSTSDGKYSLTIDDNQGISPVRTSHIGATIRDAQDKIVGSYINLKTVGSNGSISFGHASIVDQATDGKNFTFALPSTNTPYALVANLADGTHIAYGLRFSPTQNQGELSCAAL